jgi:hypothetical protein
VFVSNPIAEETTKATASASVSRTVCDVSLPRSAMQQFVAYFVDQDGEVFGG